MGLAAQHTNEKTDWSKTLSADKSSLAPGDAGRFWRRLSEGDPDVSSAKLKHLAKDRIVAGINRNDKSRLIILLSGTIDGNSYVDEIFFNISH
jgi:hypothetical protein